MGEKIIYQLKVTLRGTRPPIWRRVRVAGDVTLYRLNDILQTVMGWTGGHLHQFCVGNTFYGTPDLEFGLEMRNEKKVRLSEVLQRPKERMVYEYDFGDGWEHDVVLEAVTATVPGERYPVVVAGKRRCPPEDVGGVVGFYDFLETMADPKHPEHKNMREWWGGIFDAKAFDIQDVNAALWGRRVWRPV